MITAYTPIPAAVTIAAMARAITEWVEAINDNDKRDEIKSVWNISYGIAFAVTMGLVSPSGVNDEGIKCLDDMINVESIPFYPVD